MPFAVLFPWSQVVAVGKARFEQAKPLRALLHEHCLLRIQPVAKDWRARMNKFGRTFVFLLTVLLAPASLPAQNSVTQYELLYRFPKMHAVSDGYAWIEFEVRSRLPKPSAYDEQFEIEFEIENSNAFYRDEPNAVSVEATVVIPAGQTSGKAKALAPGYCVGDNGNINVKVRHVDGIYWDRIQAWRNSNTVSKRVLFVAEQEIGVWSRIELKGRGRFRQAGNVTRSPAGNVSYPAFHTGFNQTISPLVAPQSCIHPIVPESLPNHWVEVSHYQMIVMSHLIWNKYVASDPDKKAALVDWMRAGGTVLIYDLENGDGDADTIRDSLAMNRTEQAILREQNWISALEPLTPADSMNSPRGTNVQAKEKIEDLRSSAGLVKVGKGFLAIAKKDVSKWNYNDWLTVDRHLNAGRAQFVDEGSQYRMSFYKSFQIPGVGQPPVIMFRLMIVLFVIIIGPVNYIMLARMRRLNLLLFTVPAISIVTCLSLLLFAMINDGFGLYGRVESVSYLDQRTGQIESQSRHQYFGASVPRNGYAFDYQTKAVASASRNSGRFFVSTGEDNYRIEGGDIRARSEHQFYVQRVDYTKAQLKIDSVTPEEVQFENQLGGRIRYLLIRDQNNYYFAENIGDGEAGTAEQNALGSCESKLGRIVADLRPDESEDDYDYYGPYGMYYGNSESEFLTDKVFNRLRMKTGIPHLKRPNSYVAILEDFSEVKPGYEKTKVRKQLHVVFGVWK